MNLIKDNLFSILESRRESGLPGKIFTTSIVIVIILNVIAVILETVEEFHNQYFIFFKWFEIFSVMIFSIEYVLRIWSCTSDKKYSHSLTGRLKYAFTFLTFIDLLAILPFYIPFLITTDLRILRLLRLFRFIRIIKLGRYSESLRVFGNVLIAKKIDLTICVFVVLILLTLTSSMMFFVEHEAQPEAFSSIPATMWWGVATLTTVGYGDVYPVTPLGKFLGAIIAILGIGMVALPAGVLASGFAEEIQRIKINKKEKEYKNV